MFDKQSKKQELADEKETSRLEAFSDGVFAVAITLLVLNIKLPGLDTLPYQHFDDNRLWSELGAEWPMFAAYITSFATIGIMWINHHRLFTHIKHADTGLFLLNLLLLLNIVFIPMPTALLAAYVTYPDLHTAALLYTGTCFFMAVLFNLLWRYASYRGRLLGKQANMQEVQNINRQFLFGPLLYFLAIVLAYINVPASLVFSFLLALFFALPGSAIRLKVNSKPALPD